MYAVYERGRMINVCYCMFFDYEYQAIFECIKNPNLTYKKIQGGN